MIIAVYLWFCAFAKHRHMTIKGQKLVLPSWKFALAQMLISSVNWMVMGAIIWLLLGQSVNYFFVLGVLLVSSIAGVIVHIPVVRAGVYRTTGWGAYLQRYNYRRPTRLPCAVLLYPTAAGADLLPVAGKPGEEATGEK